LKIDTQPLEDHQVKLVVETPSEDFEQAKHTAARKLSQKTKIPGFRPGKAPYAIVIRQFGESTIVEEALDIYIQDIYPKILEEAQIDPYGPGELDKVVSFEPPQFEFIVPLKPTIELCDYHTIRKDYDYKPIDDEDIDEAINELRERQAILEPVKRQARKGDIVYIRISGKRTDANEDSNKILFEERKAAVIIKSKQEADEDEWPYRGFSSKLVGLTVDDMKVVEHTFPKEFYIQDLQGIQASYELIVEEIKSRILPKADDEFAKSVGEYETIESLRAAVNEELSKNHLENYNQEYDEGILEEIISKSTIKYPPQMLKREIDTVLEQLKDRLKQQNSDIDLYLKTRDISMDELLEEIKPVAESRLKRSLVLFELSGAEKIKVNPEDLQTETTRTLDELTPIMQKSRMPKSTEKEMVSNLVGNIMMDMLVKQTMERLREIARGEQKTQEEIVVDQSEQKVVKDNAVIENVSNDQNTSDQNEITPK
jgi:trigger factor